MEFLMVDRHWFGDLSLAVLLALPFVALARPEPILHKHVTAPPAVRTVSASHSPGEGRISLLG